MDKLKIIIFFSLFLIVVAIRSQNLPPWSYKITDRSHNILIKLDVRITVGDTTIQKGDYIGVFYDSSGVLACAGYSEWTGEQNINVTAFGDDPLTAEKDGMALNEVFKWKIWSTEEGREYLAKASYDKTLPGILQDSLFVINGQSALLSLKTIRESGPWFYRKTSNKHFIKIPLNAKIYFENDKLERGDYIGVFYDSTGFLACAGYSMWTGRGTITVTAYGNDPNTPFLDGFAFGEKFNWKIYKTKKRKEFLALAEYDLSIDPITNRRRYPNDSLFVSNGLSGIKSLDIIILPKTYSLDFEIKKIEFGNPLDPKSYRLVGLPGESEVKIENCINATPIQDWIAFYDDGQNRLIGYDKSIKKKFSFGYGKAFWLLSKYRFYFNDTVKAAALSPNYTYNISLNNGWNIITNPFDYDIDWELVQKLNNIDDPIWEYNRGVFRKPSKMQVYRGYYFYNKKKLSSLKLPYPIKYLLSKNRTKKSIEFLSHNKIDTSSLVISVKSPTVLDIQAMAEISLKKFSNQILYKDLMPSASLSSLSLGFCDGDDMLYNFVSLPESKEVIKIPLIINSDEQEVIFYPYFSSSLSQLKFKNFDIYLFDELRNAIFKIEANQAIYLKANNARYSLIFAKKGKYSINDLEQLFVSKDFDISFPFPNPFNSSTKIDVFVKEPRKIKLTIWDAIGRKIYSENIDLHNGNNFIVIEGDKLGSSGIFFAVLSDGLIIKKEKLIYLK